MSERPLIIDFCEIILCLLVESFLEQITPKSNQQHTFIPVIIKVVLNKCEGAKIVGHSLIERICRVCHSSYYCWYERHHRQYFKPNWNHFHPYVLFLCPYHQEIYLAKRKHRYLTTSPKTQSSIS